MKGCRAAITTSGAQIRYTKNGTTPTSTTGTLIAASSGTASVASGATLKAIAFKSGSSDSTVKSGVYAASATCAAPVFNPPEVISGPHPPANYTVNLSTTTSGAQMRYTRNGTTPTATTGTLIAGTSGNVTIAANSVITLQAIAFKSGLGDSSVTSGSFDNQNGGINRPPRSQKKGQEGTGRHEASAKTSRSAPAEIAGAPGAEPEKGMSGYRLNLWNNDTLRHDPNLSLSWWKKSGTNQTTSGSRTVVYTLDLMGNRTNVSEDGVNKSYVPNNLNQYTTAHGIGATNGTSHQISSYDGTSYNYTGDTYLAKATAGNNSYTLFYDALGRCVQRTSVTNGGTAVTSYYLFEGEHWIMEYDENGDNHSGLLYGRGVDELISRGINGAGWFYFPDRNGNISVVTNGTTEVLASYRYDAFGLPAITPGAAGPIDNRFLFTGREWNPTLGFYEYRARAYNPKIGRFMSEDPKGFEAGDYNLYRYVSNDPLDKTDPMGLEGEVVIYREDGRASLNNPSVIFENGKTVASFRANENGFIRLDSGQTRGPRSGTYSLLPKQNAQPGDSFPNGQPSITAKQYADSTKANYAPGRAGPEYKAEGTVRVHNKSSDGQPDSTACVTACAPAVDRVTKLMNDNVNTGGTKIIFIDGKQTLDGREVRRAEPVVRQKYGE